MKRRIARFLLLAAMLAAAYPSLHADPLADAMRDVEKLRHRSFTSPVTSETISRSDLPARLQSQLEKSQPYSFSVYADQLRALHLIREKGDLLPSLLALLQSQVLAFYDPDSDRFYFVSPAPPGVPEGSAEMLEKTVVAHELVHALQDQRIDLSRRDRELIDDWDGSLALHSVLEGEATLVMMASLFASAGVSLDDVVADESIFRSATAMANAAPMGSDAPPYFTETLKFPYTAGLEFVAAAYRRGGWNAVDDLLANPPRSTREIVAPDEYFAHRLPPRAFKSSAASPHRYADVRLGAEHWKILLGTLVSGWIDDTAAVLLDEECRPTVLVESEWESEQSARAFARKYESFLDQQGDAATVVVNGAKVRAAYGFDGGAIREFLGRGWDFAPQEGK